MSHDARGTLSSIQSGMRCLPITAASVVIAAIAACDTATSPQAATIATGTTAASSSALTISPSSAVVLVGTQTQLTTNAPLNVQTQVQWRSSQPTVAAISPTGMLTAIAAGTTQITARYSFDTATVATASIAVTGATGTGTRAP